MREARARHAGRHRERRRLSRPAGFRRVFGVEGGGDHATSKACALELRGSGVAVVTICPGYIATPMTAGNPYPMPFLLDADKAARLHRAGDRRGAGASTSCPGRWRWSGACCASCRGRSTTRRSRARRASRGGRCSAVPRHEEKGPRAAAPRTLRDPGGYSGTRMPTVTAVIVAVALAGGARTGDEAGHAAEVRRRAEIEQRVVVVGLGHRDAVAAAERRRRRGHVAVLVLGVVFPRHARERPDVAEAARRPASPGSTASARSPAGRRSSSCCRLRFPRTAARSPACT